MMRVLKISLSVLVILFLVGTLAYFKLDLILSHTLTSKFKTNVSIEKIAFSPMSGIAVKNLTISNPENYPSLYALEIGAIAIVAPYIHYLRKITYIDVIELTDTTLTVDYLEKVTNWEALMNNLDSGEDTASLKDSYSVIKKLQFNNLTIRIQDKNGEFKIHTIDKLTLNNIKTKEGELSRRLTQAILNQILFNFKNLINIPLKMTQDAINAPVDTTLDGLKSLNPFSK